jgi:amidohydrolase
MTASIRNSISALADEITKYRRTMHENPQTAYEETFASGLVQDKLTEWGIEFKTGYGKTGLVATIKGESTSSGKSIGLRADMDALDITEDPAGKPHTSQNPGKMHACGHDGHTAMLLGAAKYLNENNTFNGIVNLIFQPAEEGAKGAHAMVADGLFKDFPCDQIFGVHNWPQMPRGTCATRVGPLMANADIFRMTIHGKGGHAAMPHNTIDPIVIGSQIVTALQSIVARNVKPTDPAVVSVTYFSAGEGAHNIIPDTAQLIGTVRTYDQGVRKMIEEKIGEISKNIAESMGGSVDYEFEFVLDATVNSPEPTAFCGEIVKDLFGDDNVNLDVDPSLGGEDFGTLAAEVPGCYIWIGQAEPDDENSHHNHGLHTPRYDFNDDIIPIGIEYWARIVEGALK